MATARSQLVYDATNAEPMLLLAGDMVLPAVIAVAAGDTTPNPGTAGVMAWSSTLGRPVYWDGSNWHPMASVSVGTTAPANPAAGDLWIDTN